MRGALAAAAAVAVALAAAGWAASSPQPLPADVAIDAEGDPVRGQRLFDLGGCASCHAAPGAEGEDRLALAGGRPLATAFGVFVSPNISPHPEAGIGRWSATDLANAMLRGVSPDGAHYYPAFPYASYARATLADVADLHAYLMTLPPSDRASEGHDLGFPWSVRRGIGLWKRLNLGSDPVVELGPDATEAARRGRELVEGLGHCGECHTPRDWTGGLDRERWLQGADNPAGDGRTPALAGIDWSEGDIAYYLETGFTPDFDSAGGEMAEVIRNLSRLPEEDRLAIAAYLKALPAPAD